MNVGDRVYWSVATRGGYGHVEKRAAVIEAIGKKKIKIRVARRQMVGQRPFATATGPWLQESTWARSYSLSPRTQHVPEVDDLEAEPATDH